MADLVAVLVLLAIGFGAGFAVRHYMSVKRRRRFRN
jgi:hypothetical protein